MTVDPRAVRDERWVQGARAVETKRPMAVSMCRVAGTRSHLKKSRPATLADNNVGDLVTSVSRVSVRIDARLVCASEKRIKIPKVLALPSSMQHDSHAFRWRAGCFTGRGLCTYRCWLTRVRSDLAVFECSTFCAWLTITLEVLGKGDLGDGRLRFLDLTL